MGELTQAGDDLSRALVRQALGTQNLPPPQVTIGLALFMTLMVMSPTIDRVYAEAVVPYNSGAVTDYETLWNKAKQPLVVLGDEGNIGQHRVDAGIGLIAEFDTQIDH